MSAPALLFDLDGTLTDPREGITRCIQHALDGLGRAVWPADALQRFIGPPLHVAFAEMLDTDNAATIARAIALYRARFEATGLFENRLHDGVADGLATLEALGFPMWVVTSKPEVYARRIVEHFQVDRYFRVVYGPDLDGARSDKGELIGHVLAQESLRPAHAWMIGDRSHDVVAARVNGVASVGVLWGYGSRVELETSGADAVVASVADLIEHLRRVAAA